MEMTLGLIGAGAMAEALISGVLKAGLVQPDQVTASDVAPARLQVMQERYRIHTATDNESVVRSSQVVVLAVKPQVSRDVLVPLVPVLSPDHLLISIVTGVTIDDLQDILDEGVPVIRVVPNTPCLVGEGASALSLGQWATPQHLQVAEALMGAVGLTRVLPEAYLDAVTALSGSGPAYIYLITEALSDARRAGRTAA